MVNIFRRLKPSDYCNMLSLAFCLGQSAAYFYQRDYRRGLYFLFAFAITLTVVL